MEIHFFPCIKPLKYYSTKSGLKSFDFGYLIYVIDEKVRIVGGGHSLQRHALNQSINASNWSYTVCSGLLSSLHYQMAVWYFRSSRFFSNCGSCVFVQLPTMVYDMLSCEEHWLWFKGASLPLFFSVEDSLCWKHSL